MRPRADAISLDETRAILARLVLAFGQPFGLSAAAMAELSDLWHSKLRQCAVADVQTAVEDWIRKKKKWPVVSDIVDDAEKLERDRNLQRRETDKAAHAGEFCPRCHTKDLIVVGRTQRFMPLHAETCPCLHEADLLEIRAALEANAPIWRNGQPSEDHRRHMSELRQRLAREHAESNLVANPVGELEPVGTP
jgi:hypothetical protein